jgi:hypothetical protein
LKQNWILELDVALDITLVEKTSICDYNL